MSDFEMWMGSEKSYKETHENLHKVSLASGESFDPTDYALLSTHEGIGIIDVSGSLVTNAPAFATMFGVLGYNVLKDTLVVAAQDPEIKHILLNIDSSGGSANGIDSVSELIKTISSTHKPVTAFTDTKAHSAAYWIAAATDSISATRMADVGSIGVISVLTEYTKAMEKDGVTATVLRSGEFKALGSSMEVLTPEAKAVIQGKLDALYTEFTSHISHSRPGLSADTTQWAEGKTFLGKDAIGVGLVDNITTFEKLTTSLVKKNAAQGKSGRMQLSTEGDDMSRKKILDEKDVAMIAATGLPEAAFGELGTLAEGVEVVEVTPEATLPEEETEKVVEKGSMAEFFQAELSAATDKIITLSVENKEMKTKLETMDVTHSQLRAIASDAVNLRNLGLGRGRFDLSTVSDEVLLQTYNQVSTEFNKVFPVGGVTEVASTERKEPVVMTAMQEAAVRAAKF